MLNLIKKRVFTEENSLFKNSPSNIQKKRRLNKDKHTPLYEPWPNEDYFKDLVTDLSDRSLTQKQKRFLEADWRTTKSYKYLPSFPKNSKKYDLEVVFNLEKAVKIPMYIGF